MKIISLHIGHGATVVLAEDGTILGALGQEKCDNIKNSHAFPYAAVMSLLREVHWDISEVDEVVIAGEYIPPYLVAGTDPVGKAADILGSKIAKHAFTYLATGKYWPILSHLAEKFALNALKKSSVEGKRLLKENLKKLGLENKPISFVNHHLCHARAAYHSLSNNAQNVQHQKPALIFTLDGMGDGACATVSIANGEKFTLLAQTPVFSSLGTIYGLTTKFLGMKIVEHEYKVMGLAPYAKEKYMIEVYEKKFKPVIWLDDKNPLIFKSKINTSKFYEYLSKNVIGYRFDNIAGALQLLTENLVTQWIQEAIKKTGIKRIFTGGGVFMNVKLNRKIQEMPEVDQVFFMPSCGDESNAIGACYDHATKNGHITSPLSSLYLGVSFKETDIVKFITHNSLKDKYLISEHSNIEEVISELLACQEVVARFAGRCEWGARSLGNRAILAHPSYMESFYTVNDYIKSRDFWMPFAPSILDVDAKKYLRNYNPGKTKAQHMITAFLATELGVQHLRAALHQGDHTLRPQVLEEKDNPRYYNLIKSFKERTGVGAVLNTSLNLHGYPLVATLEQALMTFENSNLKYLALENFMIKKQ